MTASFRVPNVAASAVPTVSADAFSVRNSETSPVLAGYTPVLRNQAEVVDRSWTKQVARVLDAYQNSGFVKGIIDVSTSQVVGTGLRISSQPDAEALGWTQDQATAFSRAFESRFNAWANDPYRCDASAQLKFGQQQQAFYQCTMGYGEGLGIIANIRRPGVQSTTKVKLLPPSKIVNKTNGVDIVQGVRVDSWGMPVSIFLEEKDRYGATGEREVRVRDKDGRPIVIHRYMPIVSATRAMPELGAGMKSYRQHDQFRDAKMAQEMIHTIFGAVVKSNLAGIAAFEGLMTQGDQASQAPDALNVPAYVAAKGAWYDNAKIDLSQHGRIAQMFPGDELDFVESKAAGDDFDPIARWLLLELCSAGGVTYETGTGDYRGATYSSIRMGGAKEWLTVMRKRDGLIAPFCQSAAEAFLEEEIFTGRITIPGGIEAFYANRELISRCSWTGPAQPQADDQKTANAHKTLKEIGGTTMSDIHASYGRDWDNVMRQQKAENDLADQLGLPRPWKDPPVPAATSGKPADPKQKDAANGQN